MLPPPLHPHSTVSELVNPPETLGLLVCRVLNSSPYTALGVQPTTCVWCGCPTWHCACPKGTSKPRPGRASPRPHRRVSGSHGHGACRAWASLCRRCLSATGAPSHRGQGCSLACFNATLQTGSTVTAQHGRGFSLSRIWQSDRSPALTERHAADTATQ